MVIAAAEDPEFLHPEPVALDELDSFFHRRLRIGLVVGPQTLDLPVKQPTRLYNFCD